MKTHPSRLGAKMTDIHCTTRPPQTDGIQPKVADVWIERLNDHDRIWWRWTGKAWKHDSDNISEPKFNENSG